ncbi:histidine kinase [Nitrosopumilus sp. b3]|uniref:sensor histidine kinase n=1 Tax=Nitrosopumilus sp. b3 TaxID=2109909 RepID=UPI0015F6E63F|nr:HAMP domain-containing sensor histidine kinase [Nitrosopumilus sp. b3]KAF6247266.1 histidine kinase [Nitrosopumilus sp. b3]
MRKYIVRKNFNQNNLDELNAPNRTVFFEKKKKNEPFSAEDIKSNNEIQTNSLNPSIDKNEIKTNFEEELLNTEARKIFDESISAMEQYDKKRLDNIYNQLSTEKKISKELNQKLHKNLSKIASAELELIKKKNQLEKDLDEKTKKLIDSERFAAIGKLSGKLAHELRTPLTVIKGSVGVMKHKKGDVIDDAIIQKLELMEESVYRMNNQVEKVLNFVQKYPLNKKEVSLRELIQKSVSLLRKNSNITILTPKNDILFNCDPIKMEVVIGNILLNAVQAIEKEIGQIIIEITESPDSIKITIQDSGKGISEELSDKIFDPLISSKMDGTGLGLSSVKNIVEQHGGVINFKNNPTTFTIIFPK